MALAAHVLEIASSRGMLDDIENCGNLMELSGDVRRLYWERAQEKLDGLNALALAMPEADDEGDLVRSLAAMWLELRFEWHRHNQVSNYTVFRTGQSDPLEMAAGSFCSGLLARLEALIGPDAMEKLNAEATGLLDRTLQELQARTQPQGTSA